MAIVLWFVSLVHCHTSLQPYSIDFLAGNGRAANRPAIRVAHGALMFLAWGVFLPLGIFMARFTKGIHSDVSALP